MQRDSIILLCNYYFTNEPNTGFISPQPQHLFDHTIPYHTIHLENWLPEVNFAGKSVMYQSYVHMYKEEDSGIYLFKN